MDSTLILVPLVLDRQDSPGRNSSEFDSHIAPGNIGAGHNMTRYYKLDQRSTLARIRNTATLRRSIVRALVHWDSKLEWSGRDNTVPGHRYHPGSNFDRFGTVPACTSHLPDRLSRRFHSSHGPC